VNVVKKCIVATSGRRLVFCTAWKQGTVGVYDQSYTFAHPAIQTARWS